MSSDHWPVLTEAHRALLTAVTGLTPEDLERPTPCSEWTVAQVVQHAAGDQLGYAAFLGEGSGPDADPFAPSGSLTASPEALVRAATGASARAFAGVTPDQENVPVPLPPNKMPAPLAVAACALDAAVHAWDITRATHRPSPLTDALAAQLLPAARTFVEPVRAFAFAPQITTPPTADPATELLHYLGRTPDWVSPR
jgi:uncharacterized protein (TIGR03086 family)